MKYQLLRDITQEECFWTMENEIQFLQKGMIVHKYSGHTYGCVSPTGTAVTVIKDTCPFIEVPTNALKPLD
ncbi:MAG: hypothetical protein AABY07_00870 [Nanoarchaeota archaeon]